MADSCFGDETWGREKLRYQKEEGPLLQREVREKVRAGERPAQRFTQDALVYTAPWFSLGENIPLLEYIWKKVFCLFKNMRPTGHH